MPVDEPQPRSDRRAERGEATRAALVGAARELFSERGYSGVGTNEVVAQAGVTRGAMYHHFRDKQDLFRAVYEQTEREIVESTAAAISTIDDPWEMLASGVHSFFDACTDPALRQIGLVDGPAVLGWQEWREIGGRYGMALVTLGLQNAMDRGTSWFGTLTFGLVYQFTGSYRPAIFALIVFFVLGGAVFMRVDTARGIRDAGNDLPPVI